MRNMKESGIDWIGKIPVNWSVMPNKWVMHKQKDLCEKYNNEDILSLTMKGVIVRDLDAGGKIPTTFDGYQKLEPNNLLMCLFDYDVTPRCVGLIKNYGLTSPAYSQFVMDRGNVPSYYYYYYLMIDNTKELLHLAKNLRHSFTEEQLGEIYTPVPPIFEQEKIAHYLDIKISEIDNIIEKSKETINDYREYKKSIIIKRVTNGFNKDELLKYNDEWFKVLPKKWNLIKLKKCFISRDGGNWGSEPKLNKNDKICIRIADFDYDNLTIKKYNEYTYRNYNDDIIKKLKVHKGDILIEKSGGGEKTPVGRSVIIKEEIDALFANFMERLIVNQSLVEPDYMEYVLTAFYKNNYVLNYIKQTTGIQNLDITSMLNREKCPIPNKTEQIKIVECLNECCENIDKLIKNKEKTIEELEQYKRSLIYEYVTGKKEIV